MATRYATGTGVWNAIGSWGASSGATGASVPVDGDDVIFDGNSGTITLDRAERCDNLTLGSGTLTTSGTNYALVVDEQMLVNGGTLTLNGSTVDFGNVAHSSGTINGNTSTIDLNNGDSGTGYIWAQTGGTWNYDTSTVVCKESGKHLQTNAFYNLTVSAPSSANLTHWRDLSGNTMTVHGALLITEGVFRRATTTDTLVVTGDVTIQDGGTFGRTNLSESGATTFGSLTIASGGTYNATSGTTTITGEASSYALKNDGTFTHNNGLVVFDFAAHTLVKNNTFYDLELNMDASSWELAFSDTSGNAVDILGDLTITQGTYDTLTTSDTHTIHGNTHIAANGLFFATPDHDTNKIIHHGLVTNLGTYKINDGTTVKMNGGIRQLGTLTIA